MLVHSIIIAMLVLFLHYTSWDGEVFEGIKKLVKPKGWLYKPLYGCPVCMVPWWGSGLYWLIYGTSVTDWAITVGAAAGINVLSVVALSCREACINYNKQFEDGRK